MHPFFLFLLLASFSTLLANADSGGPYVGVPDATDSEKGPVFQIPRSEKPLRYYLTNMPQLTWNKKINEPDGFTWQPISGFVASVSELYHGMLCVRYISDERIEQGNDLADTILILARNSDTGPSPSLCVPVYFTSGGPGVFNVKAEAVNNADDGAIKITGYIGGTAHIRTETFLRYQDNRFVRFTPKKSGTGQKEPDAKLRRHLPDGVHVSADVMFHASVLDPKTRKSVYGHTESDRASVRFIIENKSREEVALTMSQVAPDLFYVTDDKNNREGTAPGSNAASNYDLTGKITLRANARLHMLAHTFGNVTAVLIHQKGVYYLRHETHEDIVVCFELDGKGGMSILDQKP